jgi:hypothetical protein
MEPLYIHICLSAEDIITFYSHEDLFPPDALLGSDVFLSPPL